MNKVETKKNLLPFQSQLASAVVMFALLVPGFSIRASDNEPSSQRRTI